jgi:hypothetical protein
MIQIDGLDDCWNYYEIEDYGIFLGGMDVKSSENIYK